MSCNYRSDDTNADGAVARSLFRTDSDMEETEMNFPQEEQTAVEGQQAEKEPIYVRRPVMNVILCERQVGAGIAHKLWPAAECLAQFVMDVATGGKRCVSDAGVPKDERGRGAEVQAWQAVEHMLLNNREQELQIIELGAGIGLTGLQVATQLPCHVILTDLDEALPLLQTNTEANQDLFIAGSNAVIVKRLAWGNADDCSSVLSSFNDNQPVLILASDCVYFEELHEPLEQTLKSLLSKLPPKSLCLMAGVRRWKRDNTFYAKLGSKTKTSTHKLRCTPLEETMTRSQEGKREIMRVFCIQWLPSRNGQKA